MIGEAWLGPHLPGYARMLRYSDQGSTVNIVRSNEIETHLSRGYLDGRVDTRLNESERTRETFALPILVCMSNRAHD